MQSLQSVSAGVRGSHLCETQGVEADGQDSGSFSVLDLSEDPVPLPLHLIIPEEVENNGSTHHNH